ncbi:18206_t:CDS:2 [Rhizophagus irregularis]|nr:18206_t:CDS:2 [Rhizophagus irregularis]
MVKLYIGITLTTRRLAEKLTPKQGLLDEETPSFRSSKIEEYTTLDKVAKKWRKNVKRMKKETGNRREKSSTSTAKSVQGVRPGSWKRRNG